MLDDQERMRGKSMRYPTGIAFHFAQASDAKILLFFLSVLCVLRGEVLFLG
jgi:hypothetical protein